jgi:hypothetical protein
MFQQKGGHMGRCILVWACFTAFVLTGSSADASSDDEAWQKSLERLASEATALYARVLEKEKPPTDRCSLNSEWFQYSVPEDVARKHLGLKLHAQLAAPYNTTTPAKVLDPAGKMREAFCSADELDKYLKQAMNALRTKLIAENARPDGLQVKLRHTRGDYSFPVFNENFDRAIIVQAWAESSWTWGSPYLEKDQERKLFGSVSGSIQAYIWAKKDGVWQQISIEAMASFH